jgi:chorismate--pyruvate lyase
LLSSRSFLFNREPFRFVHPRPADTPTQAAASWLYETGSLTERLRRTVDKDVRVSIVLHCRHKPFYTESRLLNLPERRFCLIREVILHALGRPLILARTVIPADTLKGPHGNLAKLGTRPLGEVIFSYPSLKRRLLQIADLTPSIWNTPLQNCAAITESVWGRRTVYEIAGRPLIVNEFFLPALLQTA